MGTEYSAVRKAVAAGISAGYENSISSQWSVWLGFCAGIGLDPHFENVTDPIPFLQIFAHRVRTGDIATHGKQVRKRTVEQHIRAVGQGNTSLGASGPRHNKHGTIDFRIYRQLRSYTREDPPPARVKPLPTSVIQHVYDRCIAGNDCEK